MADATPSTDPPRTESAAAIRDIEAAARAWLGNRVKSALQARRVMGLRAGEVPWGYQVDPKDRKKQRLVPCPREQDIIRRILAMADAGYSQRETAEVLAEHGYLSRQGTPLTQGSIHRILRNHRAPSTPADCPADGFYADKATGRRLVKLNRKAPAGMAGKPANDGGSAPEPRKTLAPLLVQTLVRRWAEKGYSVPQIRKALRVKGYAAHPRQIRAWLKF